MLKITDLKINVNKKELFSCKDLQLNKGLFALVGRNGSGKSTFFKTLIQQHNQFLGTVVLNGKRLEEVAAELAKMVSIVKSHAQVYGSHTVEDILNLGRIPYLNYFGKLKKEDHDFVQTIADKLNLRKFMQNQFSELSDGEKQLVMIGRALVQDTPIVLLDEPLAFLDLVNQKEIMNTLKAISTSKLILFSTHHITALDEFCDGVVLIHEGEMFAIQPAENFEKNIRQKFNLN